MNNFKIHHNEFRQKTFFNFSFPNDDTKATKKLIFNEKKTYWKAM